MNSNDLIIRTERNVIDVVLSNGSEIKSLRRDFEEFRAETRQNLSVMAAEIRGLDKTVDRMISIFGWGFTLVAIAAAIAPMLRELFVYKHEKALSDDLDRKIDRKIREALDAQNPPANPLS